jgi:hypothetical protein
VLCFQCKTQYQPGILHCSQCGSALVYRFPSPQWISEFDKRLVFLRRFKTQFAGEIAKVTLKAGGIECLLSFEAGAEIFVRSEDVEDAKVILSVDVPEPL